MKIDKELNNSILGNLSNELLKNLFNDAFSNYEQANDSIKINSFAFVLRSIVEIYLNQKAPQEELNNCKWYNKKKKLREQKISYCIRGGLSDEIIKRFHKEKLPAQIQTILTLYDNLSNYTHIKEDTYNLPPYNQDKLFRAYLLEFNNFFEYINNFRKKLYKELYNDVCNSDIDLYSLCINDLPHDFSLSIEAHIPTGAILTGIADIDFEIININCCSVELMVGGVVEYEGNTLQVSGSTPFKVPATLSIDLKNIQYVLEEMQIEELRLGD